MLLVPAAADAGRPGDKESPRQRLCNAQPNRPGCDRVNKIEERREQKQGGQSACTVATRQLASANSALKKANKGLSKAKKGVKKAKGKKAKAKAKAKRKRAAGKVKKAKGVATKKLASRKDACRISPA